MTCPKVVKVKTPGPPGPAGNPGPPGIGAAWRQGAGVPGSGVGSIGDFYLNTSNGDIYGPKTSGGWGSVIFNIAEGQEGPQGLQGQPGQQGNPGADGRGILSGLGAPSSSTGVNGDFYIDLTTPRLYGPKASGAWGAGKSLVGDPGPTGSSAYQAAVAGGFSGTEAQWLASLVGPPGQPGQPGQQGNPGAAGAAATISVGTVTTGAAGSSVTVNNAGSSSAAVFDFSIPRGATGATGATGPKGDQGPAATPGGSSGEVLVNINGDIGGLSTFTADGSGNLTLSARLINTFNAAASAPAKLFRGTWFTGGTSTTTKPHLLIEPAGTTSTHWNTAGTGLGVNGASGFLGDLAWLGVNGASYARITVSTSNVFLGQSAGQSVTNYTSIVAIGQNAFGSATTAGNGIIAIGAATLRYLSVANGSTEAVGLGSNAGTRIAAATSSVLLGAYAGQGSTAFSARISRTTCAGFEAGAGFDATTLADNSFFGFRAGFAVSSGNQNTFLGSGAGSTVTTGSNNIAIGFNAALDSITTSNQINIGNVYYHDRITGSKTFTGNVGFYNATPVAQPAAVADATDAASAITQLNALLARLRSLGLIAT
jgi:hypothetical protein